MAKTNMPRIAKAQTDAETGDRRPLITHPRNQRLPQERKGNDDRPGEQQNAQYIARLGIPENDRPNATSSLTGRPPHVRPGP